MYQEYYGLHEMPFSLTPNTQYFLNAESHQEALTMLRIALDNHEGFIKVVGEVGTGKTLLCRKLLNGLDDAYVTAYLANPCQSPLGLYIAIAEELSLQVPDTAPERVLGLINERLITLARDGKRVVLLVDEAQAMPELSIEALRLLTNLETEQQKLLQVVLFGQPELDALLSRPSLRQLRQRITFACCLQPLDRAALEQYLVHRLVTAGYNGPVLFTRAAIQALYRASQGVPRLINILAHKALLVAYGKGARQIEAAHVRRAIADTEGVPRRLRWLLKIAPWAALMMISDTLVQLGSLLS